MTKQARDWCHGGGAPSPLIYDTPADLRYYLLLVQVYSTNDRSAPTELAPTYHLRAVQSSTETTATMPRAEVGTAKHLANKMKSKGLQRLRWYCQVCERQMRDENGFKCHTQSESHVRQMLLVGEDPRKHISDYSNQFQRDFLTLLRTSHGEKKINANHFYQEYIANKEHVHMNATRWLTLSEFIKHLGRNGICRVEEGERGFMVSWIDNSPEALRRQEHIRKKERQDRGDEQREQKMIREQVERARKEAEAAGKLVEGEDDDDAKKTLQKQEGEKITLDFVAAKKATPPIESEQKNTALSPSAEPTLFDKEPKAGDVKPTTVLDDASAKVSMKIEAKPKKNVFASMGKSKSKEKKVESVKRPISEAERIMKEEMERSRMRPLGVKRQRVV